METVEIKMNSLKDQMEQSLKNFKAQLAAKEELHMELTKKAGRLMDSEYTIKVYEEVTNIGVEKHQLECDMEIIKFHIQEVNDVIQEIDKIIETENFIKEMDKKTAEMADFSMKQLAEIEQQIEQN